MDIRASIEVQQASARCKVQNPNAIHHRFRDWMQVLEGIGILGMARSVLKSSGIQRVDQTLIGCTYDSKLYVEIRHFLNLNPCQRSIVAFISHRHRQSNNEGMQAERQGRESFRATQSLPVGYVGPTIHATIRSAGSRLPVEATVGPATVLPTSCTSTCSRRRSIFVAKIHYHYRYRSTS
jgi:hypothetical protein